MNCKYSLISIQTFVPKEILPVLYDHTEKIQATLQQQNLSVGTLYCILTLLTSCYVVKVYFLRRNLVL